MYINKLIIQNFHCYKDFEITFARSANVLIGRNGAGKSSLLKALVYALYFMFSKDRSFGKDNLTVGNPDLGMKSPSIEEFYRSPDSDEVGALSLKGFMDLNGESLIWEMYKRPTRSALMPTKYRDAFKALLQYVRNTRDYPLVVLYSDSFPHKHASIKKFAASESKKGAKTLRNFGYYQWDDETACTTLWQQRLTAAMVKDKMISNADEDTHNEVEYITNKLIAFSRPISSYDETGLSINSVFVAFDNRRRPILSLRLSNGQDCLFDNLPAGYLRLYSIALDLAYRSYLLNREKADQTSGVVLIDEIDLHLHPSLEKEAVERFTRTFPNFQYIVTTHSPLVISHLKTANVESQIIRLQENGSQPQIISSAYGVDYDIVLWDFMGTSADNEQIEELKSSILRGMRVGNNALVEKRKEELKEIVPENQYLGIIRELEERAQNH